MFPLLFSQREIQFWSAQREAQPSRHGVKAITERFPMAKANEAIAKVKKSKVRYRAVLAN